MYSSGVFAGAKCVCDIVGLVLKIFVVRCDLRRQLIAADSLAIETKLINSMRGNIGSGFPDIVAALEALLQKQRRYEPFFVVELREHFKADVVLRNARRVFLLRFYPVRIIPIGIAQNAGFEAGSGAPIARPSVLVPDSYLPLVDGIAQQRDTAQEHAVVVARNNSGVVQQAELIRRCLGKDLQLPCRLAAVAVF